MSLRGTCNDLNFYSLVMWPERNKSGQFIGVKTTPI